MNNDRFIKESDGDNNYIFLRVSGCAKNFSQLLFPTFICPLIAII